MNLTQNFTLEEMIFSSTARLRKIDNRPNSQQLNSLKRLCEEILQPVRDKYEKPITITNGFRCPTLNSAIGGSKTSQHLKGEAADIISENNKELWDLICSMIQSGEISVGQLIDERNLSWIHISLPTPTHHNQIKFI